MTAGGVYIFQARAAPETIRVSQVPVDPGVHTDPLREPEWLGIALSDDRAIDRPTQTFAVAMLIVERGEVRQRESIRRAIVRGTRNIPTRVQGVKPLLGEVIARAKARRDGKGGVGSMDVERIKEVMRSGMDALRAELGIGETNPMECSYSITDGVLNAIVDPRCRQFLEEQRALHPEPIFPDGLARLAIELERYPQGGDVVDLIRQTETREHLSAISVTLVRNDLIVEMANVIGKSVRIPAWGVTNLVEQHDTVLQLGEIAGARGGQGEVSVQFCNIGKGVVYGRFVPGNGFLEVRCLDGRSVLDGAKFLVDVEYILAIYAVLKRLRADRERFARLIEKADVRSGFDPFE